MFCKMQIVNVLVKSKQGYYLLPVLVLSEIPYDK